MPPDDLVIDDPSTVRVPMRDRSTRQASRSEEPAGPQIDVSDATGADHQDPESQLADIARSLEESQAAVKAAEARARTEADHRGRAERELARQRTVSTQSRAAVVAGAVETAVSQVAAAEQAYITALENADIPAQVKAQRELAAATTRHVNASAELAQIKATAGDPTGQGGDMVEPGQQPQPKAGDMDPRAQAWIDRHPRFKGERGYRDAVLKAHADALEDGIQPNTPAYFRELDRVAQTLDGGDNGGDQMNGNGGQRRESFGGARPNGGGGANSGGTRTVQTALGAVTVGRKADGTVTLRVDPGKTEDFREGASICQMDYGEYVYEQVKIAEEQAAGGSAGMNVSGERVYR